MLVRVFFFILLLTTSLEAKDSTKKNSVDPYCYTTNNFDNKTDIIQIKILKNRRWIENLLNLIIQFNKSESKTTDKGVFNFKIDRKYKKYYKAKVTLKKKKNNINCEFDARIKVTGDAWWHLNWINGMPYASMHVNLTNGHLRNKVNFKLLIPKSRNGDNEIFIVSILRYLGFVAPQTFYANVEINGNIQKFIFQENLKKELLESNSLVEGPIIEGDERYTIEKGFNGKSLNKISLSRISNSRYIKNDIVKAEKSLEAITLMNQIYIQSHLTKKPNIELLKINKNIFKKYKFYENFEIYESLIYAMDAIHGQSHDDRRFYYDPINNYFIPIYYDGKSKILNNENSDSKSLKYLDKFIPIEAKKGASAALKMFNNINDKELISILDNNGLNLKKNKYLIIKNKIFKRLDAIKNSNPNNYHFFEIDEYFKRFENHKEKIKLVFGNKDEVKICNLYANNCEKIKIKENNLSILKKSLAQDFSYLKSDNNFYLFVGTNKNYDEKVNFNNFEKIKINENFSLSYNKEIKLMIDYEKKIININQVNSKGRAILSGEKISKWKINYFGSKELENEISKKNFLNLTGCVTFVDISLDSVNFYAENSRCEDAINLIRAKGNIKNIEIFNSMYDGLDIDFSSLKIENILVNKSSNDCIDFSFGTYEINSSKLTNCGDKGISIGEKSTAKLKYVEIANVKTGIASKDSSIAKVSDAIISNTNTCVSVYKKKQEFGGSFLNIKNLKCLNYREKLNKDLYSNIDIKN